MGTTTKMAIPYPEATGLVKDGWEDMKDIATQVDAKSGLVLISTASFSSVSSVSLPNNTFTTTYDSYLIKVRVSAHSADGTMQFRLRASGSDLTNAVYFTSLAGVTARAGADNINTEDLNIAYLWRQDALTGTYWNCDIQVHNPASTAITSGQVHISGLNNSSFYLYQQGMWAFNTTTIADSASFIPNAGTFSGSYSVFGYNK